MVDFQRVSPDDKRTALKNLIDTVTNNFNEDFVFYEVPKTLFLTVNSRMQRREIQENANGDVRHIDVFWEGPIDQNSTQLQNLPGLTREGNLQMGTIDTFRVVIWFGVSYDDNGEINNRQVFEDLLGGYSTKGIFPTLREKEAIEDANGTGRTVLLSKETNVTLPPMPRPLVSSGEERAHYTDFNVLITDM